jgi:hypothetical protein
MSLEFLPYFLDFMSCAALVGVLMRSWVESSGTMELFSGWGVDRRDEGTGDDPAFWLSSDRMEWGCPDHSSLLNTYRF